MSNIIFTHDDKVIPEEFDLGSLRGEEETPWFTFFIQHDSRKSIKDCSFYLSAIEDDYQGSADPRLDYRNALWLADNYPGYGFEIKQKYEIFGKVEDQYSQRLIDTKRKELIDIFTGEYLEIVSGDSSGERRLITGYDGDNGLFFLESDFTNVKDQTYKVSIETIDSIKTLNGSSSDHPINLLYRGGIIERFEKVKFELRLRIPPYFKKSSINNVDFNLKFTPEE